MREYKIISLIILAITTNVLVATVLAEIDCPDDPGPGQYLFPHPNCSLFYVCEEGNLSILECPLDLYYNPAIKVCDYPENVPECQDGTRPPIFTSTTSIPPTTPEPSTTAEPITMTTTEQTTITTDEPTEPPRTTPSPNDWVTIARRGTDLQVGVTRQTFDLGWAQFVNGFGNSSDNDFWLGLDRIADLTRNGDYEFRVDLISSAYGSKYAFYEFFQVSDSSDDYRLVVSGHSGTAVDALRYSNNMKFTTKDRDNDNHLGGNCASMYQYEWNGAWWHNACFHANLNVPCGMDCTSLWWTPGSPLPDRDISFSEMKIRPRL